MSYNENKNNFSVVILAAGESKRMGKPKGLLNYHGQPFLQYQLESLVKLGFKSIVVVLGKTYDLYLNSVPLLKKSKVVKNEEVEKGQFYSLQCGLKRVVEIGKKGAFILPVDVSCPGKETWNKLISSSNNYSAVVPRFKERKGHPVYLSSGFCQYLLSISSDKRLDYEIKALERENKVKIVDVNDKRIILNLNTLEEWKKYVNEK